MVPSQIKVQSLAQIIMNSKVALRAPNNTEIVEGQTVQEAYNAFMSDLSKSQERNNILDLEFNIDEASAEDGASEQEATEASDQSLTSDLLSKI